MADNLSNPANSTGRLPSDFLTNFPFPMQHDDFSGARDAPPQEFLPDPPMPPFNTYPAQPIPSQPVSSGPPPFVLTDTYSNKLRKPQAASVGNSDDISPSTPCVPKRFDRAANNQPAKPPASRIPYQSDWNNDVSMQSPRIVQNAPVMQAPHTPYMSAVTIDSLARTPQQQSVKAQHNHLDNHPTSSTHSNEHSTVTHSYATMQPASPTTPIGKKKNKKPKKSPKGRRGKCVLEPPDNINVGYIAARLEQECAPGEPGNVNEDDLKQYYKAIVDRATKITEDMKIQERTQKREEHLRKRKGEPIDPKTASRLEASLSRYRKDLLIQVLLQQVRIQTRDILALKSRLQSQNYSPESAKEDYQYPGARPGEQQHHQEETQTQNSSARVNQTEVNMYSTILQGDEDDMPIPFSSDT